MIVRHQTSHLTKHGGGGIYHTIRYSFLARLMLIVAALTVLMVLTIGTNQGTENLMASCANGILGGTHR